jgi:hypothetical protein
MTAQSQPDYVCGTCGAVDLIIRWRLGGSHWIVTCDNGHEWIPMLSTTVHMSVSQVELQGP